MARTINELCEFYGSDKCPKIAHSYAPFYDQLFSGMKDVKRVLELGAGCTGVMEAFVKDYKNCASLFVWREYFSPDTQIYGLDNQDQCNIKEDRIHVHIGDQTKEEDLQQLVKMAGGEFDIIIDDCSHKIEDQLFSAHFLLPHLKKGGVYCIEDVYDAEINFARIHKEFKQYYCQTTQFRPGRNDCIAVIKK